MGKQNNVWDSIRDVAQLEQMLSNPTDGVVETMRKLEGDVMFLGAGGKIGLTLSRMARRACDAAGIERRVIGVSRFSDQQSQKQLETVDVETIRCDLLDRASLNELPEAPNVVYMAALKFGATGQESAVWAINTYLPGMVCEKFRNSRIVTYSTGNVYGMAPVDGGGSVESDPLRLDGDYAMSCMGRERIFAYFSKKLNVPVAMIRLNYAHELRYGIMVDLAQQVMASQPIDLAMGYFNAVWQRDANAMTLRAFEHVATPPTPINEVGPERLSVRKIAEEFARLFGKQVTFTGTEAPDAFLSNGRLGYELLGSPTVDAEQMIRWIADWQLHGGPTLGKPTHFQTRDGKF